jgi:dTMP kinase
MAGAFVSVEGPDGSGKTTLVGLLAEHYRNLYPVVKVREPGGTEISEQIRTIILNPDYAGMSWRTEALLYVAARAQVVEEIIRPALARGQVVLCDRFFDSTIAYQGFGRGLPIPDLTLLNEVATGGLEPDLTILLDIDADVALRRRAGFHEPDRLEREEIAFHRRVRQGFLAQARRDPDRIRLVAADQPAADVFAETLRLLEPLLKSR